MVTPVLQPFCNGNGLFRAQRPSPPYQGVVKFRAGAPWPHARRWHNAGTGVGAYNILVD